MNITEPSLQLTGPHRRDWFLSFVCSLSVTTAVFAGLALVSLHSAERDSLSEDFQPILLHQEDRQEESPSESEKATPALFQPAPVISRATKAPTAQKLIPQIPSPPLSAVMLPSEMSSPVMDDLAWAEESFAPWIQKKKPEIQKALVVKKTAPQKKSSKSKRPSRPRSAPKIKSAQPISAKLISRITPSYPRKARRSGLEGRVVVTLTISSSGRVLQARVSQSSRHSSLDSAALQAAKKHRFSPAKNKQGQPISSQVSLPFNFKLT